MASTRFSVEVPTIDKLTADLDDPDALTSKNPNSSSLCQWLVKAELGLYIENEGGENSSIQDLEAACEPEGATWEGE